MELIAAGHETTAKLIANGIVALTWYRDQRTQLVEDESLIPQAVEEMLRWDPTVALPRPVGRARRDPPRNDHPC